MTDIAVVALSHPKICSLTSSPREQQAVASQPPGGARLNGSGGMCARPQVGAVVEYPLRDIDCTADRYLGVGLLVGRNKDRGDAAKLPPEQLDLCEIEPLQQQEADSSRWVLCRVSVLL